MSFNPLKVYDSFFEITDYISSLVEEMLASAQEVTDYAAQLNEISEDLANKVINLELNNKHGTALKF